MRMRNVNEVWYLNLKHQAYVAHIVSYPAR